MLMKFILSLVAIATILPNMARIARYLDNRMLENRRPNRRDAWWS